MEIWYVLVSQSIRVVADISIDDVGPNTLWHYLHPARHMANTLRAACSDGVGPEGAPDMV